MCRCCSFILSLFIIVIHRYLSYSLPGDSYGPNTRADICEKLDKILEATFLFASVFESNLIVLKDKVLQLEQSFNEEIESLREANGRNTEILDTNLNRSFYEVVELKSEIARLRESKPVFKISTNVESCNDNMQS